MTLLNQHKTTFVAALAFGGLLLTGATASARRHEGEDHHRSRRGVEDHHRYQILYLDKSGNVIGTRIVPRAEFERHHLSNHRHNRDDHRRGRK